jgi:5-methylcytosine-specific restriction endonuclease McrA
MIEITCLFCKNIFQVKNYRKESAKYCSYKCKKQHKAAPIIQLECQQCGKDFNRLLWQVNHSHPGKYCSIQCYQQRSPQQEIECICGNSFKAYQSRINYYHRLFCSQQCYLKNGFFGRLTDDLPELSNYGKFVAKLRSTANYLYWKQQCLQRDNSQCLCGTKENLTVHHKISIFDLIKKYGLKQTDIENDPIFFNIDNGETVCRSCHLSKHRREIDE